ncbi:hypothetical protein CAEBREN_03247 [Caenorhabditis brenneri]|uniref:Homeobox domain-containing protein n=1 Tax=Caenorhabditis brenneri TaxID=135651 RepID=G0PAV7_CAEBE|nr:hypothetical protein CAEBREN_03247 [Caenorhabditis brenneri]
MTHQYQSTQSNDGFDLFQKRLTEFAEFIVTDLRPEAVKNKWLELPERVRQEYAAEELQLHDEKQQNDSTRNVPTTAHRPLPTKITRKYPLTVAPIPPYNPQSNVRRVTYVYKNEITLRLENSCKPVNKKTLSDEMRTYLLSFRKEGGFSPSIEVIRQLSSQTKYSVNSLKYFYRNARLQK